MYFIDGKVGRIHKLIAGVGGVAAGDLVVISGGKVVKAAAAAVDATVVGIAQDTAAADKLVPVELIDNRLITAEYAGTSKTTLADTDIGTVFDLTDEQTVNLDDTTGGICFCVGYDNNAKQIQFVIPEAKKFL